MESHELCTCRTVFDSSPKGLKTHLWQFFRVFKGFAQKQQNGSTILELEVPYCAIDAIERTIEWLRGLQINQTLGTTMHLKLCLEPQYTKFLILPTVQDACRTVAELENWDELDSDAMSFSSGVSDTATMSPQQDPRPTLFGELMRIEKLSKVSSADRAEDTSKDTDKESNSAVGVDHFTVAYDGFRYGPCIDEIRQPRRVLVDLKAANLSHGSLEEITRYILSNRMYTRYERSFIDSKKVYVWFDVSAQLIVTSLVTGGNYSLTEEF